MGTHVAQVVEINESVLLVAVWDESGYYLLDRTALGKDPVKIKDEK